MLPPELTAAAIVPERACRLLAGPVGWHMRHAGAMQHSVRRPAEHWLRFVEQRQWSRVDEARPRVAHYDYPPASERVPSGCDVEELAGPLSRASRVTVGPAGVERPVTAPVVLPASTLCKAVGAALELHFLRRAPRCAVPPTSGAVLAQLGWAPQFPGTGELTA